MFVPQMVEHRMIGLRTGIDTRHYYVCKDRLGKFEHELDSGRSARDSLILVMS
jgi:hypothetical protein